MNTGLANLFGEIEHVRGEPAAHQFTFIEAGFSSEFGSFAEDCVETGQHLLIGRD